MEKMKMETVDNTARNIDKIAAFFPTVLRRLLIQKTALLISRYTKKS